MYQRNNRYPPPLLVGTHSALRHLPGIATRSPLALLMNRARGSAPRKRRRKKRKRIRIRTGTRTGRNNQPLGLPVNQRCMPKALERNQQGRRLRVNLSPPRPPRPPPCRCRGDEQPQWGPRASRALHTRRRESRRVLPLSVGEAGAEGEVEVEAGVGGDEAVAGAEAAEQGQKTWTGWMSR